MSTEVGISQHMCSRKSESGSRTNYSLVSVSPKSCSTPFKAQTHIMEMGLLIVWIIKHDIMNSLGQLANETHCKHANDAKRVSVCVGGGIEENSNMVFYDQDSHFHNVTGNCRKQHLIHPRHPNKVGKGSLCWDILTIVLLQSMTGENRQSLTNAPVEFEK